MSRRLSKLLQGLRCWLAEHYWFPVLLVRICVGLEFFESGRGKLFHSLDDLIAAFESWGIPLAHIQAPFVASVELLGGICIILGLATRVFAALLVAVMSVAILTLMTHENVTSLPHGSLGDFLYLPEVGFLLIFLWLVFSGPGKVSLDGFLARRLSLEQNRVPKPGAGSGEIP